MQGKGFQVYKPDKIFRFGKWINIHYWTEEDDLLLRKNYKHTTKSLRQLSTQLDVTENSVRQRLTRMGILRQAVLWTPSEIQFLEENYDKKPNATLARLLHKSVSSVTAKAHRLRTKKQSRSGWFTLTEVASIFGVDIGWIRRRLKSGQCTLDIAPFDSGRIPQKGQYDSWMISEEALRDFIRTYPDELTGCNIDIVMIVDILAGIKVRRRS